MNIKNLLTSFDGRIRRRTFWFGNLLVVILTLVVFLILIVVPLKMNPYVESLFYAVIYLYPTCAIAAKRLHDRNKPTMPWLAIFIIPTLPSILAQLIFIRLMESDNPVMKEVEAAAWGVHGILIMTLFLIPISLWVLFEMSLLPGTKGPNNFGPDPKEDDQPTPRPHPAPPVGSAPTINPPTEVGKEDSQSRLQQLLELKELGAITAEEFEAKKASLLKNIQ